MRDKQCQACESFDKRGLKTHEQEVQSGIVTCLGNQLGCVEHRSSPTDVRFWPLKRALEYALSVKRLPARIWEVFLGHCTFLGLQERACLSTFFTVYLFIRKYHYTSEPLWGFSGLMYFLQSSCRLLSWSLIVAASDASPSGYAVCIGKWLQQKVAPHGRVLERSRLKCNPGSPARDTFFQADDFVIGADGLWHPRVEAEQAVVNSVWSQVTDFLEVELSLLQKRDCGVLSSVRNGNSETTSCCARHALFFVVCR